MQQLRSVVEDAYRHVRELEGQGEVASYIPQLAHANPEHFGVAFCGVDGGECAFGEADHAFCIQSCCKPLNYMLARSLQADGGATTAEDAPTPNVHDHVGYEPSGRAFNAFALNREGLPHNPLINAGAIMVASLILPTEEPSVRLNRALAFYADLAARGAPADNEDEGARGDDGKGGGDDDGEGARDDDGEGARGDDGEGAARGEAAAAAEAAPAAGGGARIAFDSGVYLSERHHSDRNRSLAYYMRENRAYPDRHMSPSKLDEHLDLYFQCCSITMDCRHMARVGATMANAGVRPGGRAGGERVVDPSIVKDTLTIMHGCGMYDYSGQFAFRVGLPAKSGVSGCIFVVIPGVGALAAWSPPLDAQGNSYRGVELCRRLTELTHSRYHCMTRALESAACERADAPGTSVHALIEAAARGELDALKAAAARSPSPGEALEQTDYDGRSALHLACAEGRLEVVRWLVDEQQVSTRRRDRWGATPHDELSRFLERSPPPYAPASAEAALATRMLRALSLE
jgi:glutaminase